MCAVFFQVGQQKQYRIPEKEGETTAYLNTSWLISVTTSELIVLLGLHLIMVLLI